MATTQITITAFQTSCAECADAIDSEDWATAMKRYAKAEAINSGLDVEAAHESSRVRRRESLQGLKAAIEAARQVSGQEADDGRFLTTQTRHNS